MKRLLNLLLLLALAWRPALAQEQEQVQDLPTTVANVSYIYRNDDHFNGFADSEVDSITFSRFDADGVEHADYVTQVVYTPDSVYYIPLEAIDSVLCQQPQIELQDDVVMLSDEQRGFVVRADSTSILFRSDIPRNLLPERGKVLVGMTSGTQTGIHFAGRVLRTQYTAEGVLVTCDANVQIGDIFRRLTAVMFTSPQPVGDGGDEEWDAPHTGNREKFDPFSKSFSWEPKTRTFTDPKTGEKTSYTENYISGVKKVLGPYKKNLFDFVPDEKKPGWMKSDDTFFNVGMTFTFAYRQKFVIDFFYDKDDWVIPSLYFYWRPTMLPTIDGEAHLKINAEWEKPLTFLPDLKPIPIWTPPIPPAVPPIRIGEVNLHVSPLYVKFGGETDITYNFTIKKILDVEVEHNTSGIHVTDMAKAGVYKDQSGLTSEGFSFADSELDSSIDHLGSVYVWFAWNPSVGISLISEKVLTAAVDFKIGPWLQFNLEKTKEEPADEYTRFFQKWSPTHLLTKVHGELDFQIIMGKGTGVEQKFSLLEKLKDWGTINGDGFNFFVNRWGIFPSFGTPKLASGWQQSLNQRAAISFTTSYGNPEVPNLNGTLLSAKLGLGLYKVDDLGKQTEVATSFSKTEKGWFSKKTGDYTTEFKNVKRGVFKVAPLFDAACFNPIRATTETDVVIPASVVTEEATSVGQHHCFMNGYTLGLKEFNSAMGGGKATLGWILKKAEDSDTSNSLTISNALKTGTITEDDAVSETVNGEDKLSFGPSHSKSSNMATLTRCDGLRPATTYIYRTWAASINEKLQETVIYGETKELTTQPSDDEPRCETDLGLSVDWACYNVGAANEYSYGDYFAWGETETKKEYTAENYKLPGKENIAGDTDHDPATTWNKGKNSGWRMPTKKEIQELIDNCTMEWTTVHKVQGMRFTSKINGNSIFMPAAGNKYAKKTYSNGIGGCYWSGDLDPESLKASDGTDQKDDDDETGVGDGDARELTDEEKADAWRLHFNNVEEEGRAPHNEAGRCYYGRTIRPVRVKAQVNP
ncbi:MAG: hypothetical protein IJT48_02380 [Bacteroidaceae bacterium]|nr:hypothetical protein [Bacteroidaceae bacterium]